ncbi:MAG: sigma-54-dependent transcriptional regulator [bacterium]
MKYNIIQTIKKNIFYSKTKRIEEELNTIIKEIEQREHEISKKMIELSGQHAHIGHLPIKEKLLQEKEEKRRLEIEKIKLLQQLYPFDYEELRSEAEKYDIMTQDRALLEVFDFITKIAPMDHNILLVGEPGAGRELFTKAIHLMSNRASHAFIEADIASIEQDRIEDFLFGHVIDAFEGAHTNNDGLFSKANKGTLFINNIGTAPPEIQPKIVRVLQNGEIQSIGSLPTKSNDMKKVNVRIIIGSDKEFNENDLLKRHFNYPIILPNAHVNLKVREKGDNVPAAEKEHHPSQKEYDDQSILDELRKTHFKINAAAANLSKGRNTLTDHFKGICFKFFVQCNEEIQSAAGKIAGNKNLAEKVERKITRYYKNLTSTIASCKNADSAKYKIRKLFKNIPRQYYHYMDILVDNYFKRLKKKNKSSSTE